MKLEVSNPMDSNFCGDPSSLHLCAAWHIKYMRHACTYVRMTHDGSGRCGYNGVHVSHERLVGGRKGAIYGRKGGR